MIAKFELYLSYGQLWVADGTVTSPGCVWTSTHVAQGFARRSLVVCFATLLEFGDATVEVVMGSYMPFASDERVIAVPLQVISGIMLIGAPDVDNDKQIEVPNGHYRIVVAQHRVGAQLQATRVYCEPHKQPVARSMVVLADPGLAPPESLLEWAETA